MAPCNGVFVPDKAFFGRGGMSFGGWKRIKGVKYLTCEEKSAVGERPRREGDARRLRRPPVRVVWPVSMRWTFQDEFIESVLGIVLHNMPKDETATDFYRWLEADFCVLHQAGSQAAAENHTGDIFMDFIFHIYSQASSGIISSALPCYCFRILIC